VHELARLERELAEVTKQRDSLADALRDMLKLDDESEAAMQEIGVPALEDEHPVIRNARKALAEVKGYA
jgi:uncharacterized membrane protein YccC